LCCLAAAIWLSSDASAHPVPKSNHDRTIVVRLQSGSEPGRMRVRVDYRLEVDPATVILEDMKPFRDEIDISQFKSNLDYFKEFTRIYAPILADRLIAHFNGSLMVFVCLERAHTLQDEKGEPLDHLRCDFAFTAVLACAPDKENVLTFREANYQEQEGLINLTLVNESQASIIRKVEPDAAVKGRPANERLPGDDAKLRYAEVRFTVGTGLVAREASPAPAGANTEREEGHESGLLRLFLQSDYGFALLLLIAAYIGAMHALTPGHGKTLMAAYLVGQHGTLWHAVLLGLVTTITHTGVVLLIALGLLFLPAGLSEQARRSIQTGLGLTMGLAIVCLGFYLLLLRLSGRADHVHIGGGHHHHHGPRSMERDPLAAAPVANAPGSPSGFGSPVSTWGLVLLGMSGGLVPCTDAIAMLVLAVGMNLFWLAFPLLLAFSAGLAGVLVVIGILVVKFRDFAGSRWGEGRLVRALPIISALLVTIMGFWLCYEAVNG
jgi:ABC-type nickel/cobalt efflux system permease component RcnA